MSVLVASMPCPNTEALDRPLTTTAADESQRGVALVMALIFSILLYILVAELVVSSRMVRATGENDALLARMRTQMQYQLVEAEEKLLADLASAAAAEGEAGGEGGMGALAGMGAAAAGQEGGGEGAEEPEEDPTANCDSSRDSWFEPVGHPDNDLTTYVWIEDENRKLNLLALWSPDEEFANESQERMVRLIDALREDTEFDVSSSDATMIVQEILEWGVRPNTDQMPTPQLKSMDDERTDLHVPLHLDELLLLPSITRELFFDKVIDKRYHPGLESVLTVWTSLRPDPGNPEKVARQRAAAIARGEEAPKGSESGDPGGAVGGEGEGEGGEEAPVQPEGIGIKINVNTASRAVLRSLFDTIRVPDRVIDGIIRYRNEIDEDATEEAQDETDMETADFGDMQLGDQPLRRFFEAVDDLAEVEEFEQIPDEEIKAEIQQALTTKSDVFSINLATLYKRSENEEHRSYLIRRARSVVLRIDDGEDGQILPLIPFEERVGLRLKPVEMQDEQIIDFTQQYMEMDQFSQEERAWNPFLVDFYMPLDVRQDFISNR